MKISIITITYNAEKVLEKTILSVLQQTNHDFEYIIIDGNSKDSTVSIIKKYEQKIAEGCFPGVDSAQFKWISEPDQGIYDAMNKGIKHATGDFVWFMNAGDKIYSTETLQQIQELLDIEPECDFIYGQSIMINEMEEIVGEMKKIAPRKISKKSFLNGLVICHQSMLVHKSIASAYSLDYKIASDYDWTVKAIEKSVCQGYIDQYLSRYLTAGISAQNFWLSWRERFSIMSNHFGLFLTILAHIKIIIKYPFTRKY